MTSVSSLYSHGHLLAAFFRQFLSEFLAALSRLIYKNSESVLKSKSSKYKTLFSTANLLNERNGTATAASEVF